MNRLVVGLCATAVGCAFALPFPTAAIAKSKEEVLHTFGSGTDGADPSAGLIAVNGTLYGTTYKGGASGSGTVFSVDRQTGAETVVHSFIGTDGGNPSAGLIDVNGTLYGTTRIGGTPGYGTVFSVNPKTGAETVVYSFTGGTDGEHPYAGLIDLKGMLYGTTYDSGTYNYGTVFSVNRNTGAETVVYAFKGGTDGAKPTAGVIDVKDMLYGTTFVGGGYGYGTVFSVNRNTGAEKVLYSFTGGTDGGVPYAGLIDVKGILYGTTLVGGTDGAGTVFSVNRKTGAEKVVYSFTGGADGATPYAGVIDVNGTLYGTTQDAGTDGVGTAFSVNRKTGTQRVLHTFTGGMDGATSFASVIDVNGTLYGTTQVGGTHNAGTVFAITNP